MQTTPSQCAYCEYPKLWNVGPRSEAPTSPPSFLDATPKLTRLQPAPRSPALSTYKRTYDGKISHGSLTRLGCTTHPPRRAYPTNHHKPHAQRLRYLAFSTCNHHGPSTSTIWDPSKNVLSATTYLCDLAYACARDIMTYSRSLRRVINRVSSVMVHAFEIRDLKGVWVAARIHGY